MEGSQGLLIAINTLSSEEKLTLVKLMNSTTLDQHSHMHLLYVKPDLPTCYFNIPSMVALAKQTNTEAKTTLCILGKQLLIPTQQQWIATGKTFFESVKLAKRLHITHILTSTAEHQKMTKQLSHRRASNGCIFESLKGLKTCSLSAVFSNQDKLTM